MIENLKYNSLLHFIHMRWVFLCTFKRWQEAQTNLFKKWRLKIEQWHHHIKEKNESRDMKIYFWIFEAFKNLLCIFLWFYLSYNLRGLTDYFSLTSENYTSSLTRLSKWPRWIPLFSHSDMSFVIYRAALGVVRFHVIIFTFAERRNLFILPTCILLSIVSMLHP